jgi:hypothetical protein
MFSTPCSSIVDTSAIGRGAIPEIMSMFRSLANVMVDECLIYGIEPDALLVCFCRIIDFPPFRFAGDPDSSSGGGIDSLAVRPCWIGWLGIGGTSGSVERRDGHGGRRAGGGCAGGCAL